MTKNKDKEITDSESETLQSQGIETAIMESVKNDPDAITPTERALDNEAKEDAERILEIEETDEESQSVKHGIILTGGIDSTVMLYHLKNTLPKDAEIIPISFGDKKYITPFLREAGITTAQKSFNIDDSDADETKMLPVIEWARKNKIGALHFAANHDEGELSIANRNFPYYQRLNDLARQGKPPVQISTPFMTVTKDKIIQMAVDLYDLPLAETAPPRKGKKPIDEKIQAMRDKAFSLAYSVKYQHWIVDPFATKPKEEKTA